MEAKVAEPDRSALAKSWSEFLRRTAGVEIQVELIDPGATTAFTETKRRQKPVCLTTGG